MFRKELDEAAGSTDQENDIKDNLDQLVEYRYQLRLEHNHSDMKWYAYYAGKELRNLFDKDTDRETASDTPQEAAQKLVELTKTKDGAVL